MMCVLCVHVCMVCVCCAWSVCMCATWCAWTRDLCDEVAVALTVGVGVLGVGREVVCGVGAGGVHGGRVCGRGVPVEWGAEAQVDDGAGRERAEGRPVPSEATPGHGSAGALQ